MSYVDRSFLQFFLCFQEFQGNYDVNSIVYHDIAPAIKARFIRVHPTGWERYISMRVEFYGCFFEEWAN